MHVFPRTEILSVVLHSLESDFQVARERQKQINLKIPSELAHNKRSFPKVRVLERHRMLHTVDIKIQQQNGNWFFPTELSIELNKMVLVKS